jgi:DNA-binding CsgD family transcriptional regulator
VGRGENIWALSIQRTEAQGPFSQSELRSLAQLSQNLDSIADTASALAFARGEGALAAFDMTKKAAFLLDRRGDVVRANQAAEALLGDDVFISRRRLSSRNPQTTSAFDAAIKALLWNDAASSAPSLAFPREGRLPLLVHAIRCPGISESALSSFHALVVMTDAESRSLPAVRTLQAGFGLTASEARLAVAMRAGSDLQSEALKLGVSLETTRKHLKAIFAKTGVRRQSDLVAMLGALLPE